ncbi:MAG: hypothetical protein IKU15_04640 [Clostridia bacterium]|nr:hypothetical protein [Clostridia bacterium]
MATEDTIELLKECDSGIKMGIYAIDEVLDRTDSKELEKILINSKNIHQEIEKDIKDLLNSHDDVGKEPPTIAKGMSWLKTNMKMSMNESDNTVSSLITDGCNMGIKTLQKYLNEYENADEKSKDLAKRIISTEENLLEDIKCYL